MCEKRCLHEFYSEREKYQCSYEKMNNQCPYPEYKCNYKKQEEIKNG